MAWYISRRGFFFWRPPPQVAVHLDDPRCRRAARRRLIWFVAVPWLAATALLLAANGITTESDVRIWWELPSRPGHRFDEKVVEREDRLFNFNLHLFEGYSFWTLWNPPPPEAMHHEQVLRRRVRLGLPDPDHWALSLILTPTAGVVPLPVVAIVLLCVVHIGGGGVPKRAVLALVAPFAGHFSTGVVFVVLGALDCVTPSQWSDPFIHMANPVGYATLALGHLGPARLLVSGLRASRPRRAGVHGLVLILAFVLVLPVPTLAWLGLLLLFGTLLLGTPW